MKGKEVRISILAVVGVVVLIGCGTMPYQEPLNIGPVTPSKIEQVVTEQVMLVVDSSGSTWSKDKFPLKKSLSESFAAGMPNGSYKSGLLSFGGDAAGRWQFFPLEKFDRARMKEGAADLNYLGGSTPMDLALDRLFVDFASTEGKAALVILSDGNVRNSNAALAACRELMRVHQGEVCVHTVHFGSSKSGKAFLQDLAALSGCGSARNAADIDDPAAMQSFIREVFIAGEKDSDGDGVPDRLDQCPDTPKDVKVDKVGCPLDADGDGVPDYLDQCPKTPKGAKVDKRGCWILKGLNFDNDSFEIKSEYYPLLEEVIKVLKDNPGVRIRVDGHTDSKGSDAYNQTLSENRAKAVSKYLVDHGIQPDRLVPKGFGESKPIKANDTAENMKWNRRVELTVVE